MSLTVADRLEFAKLKEEIGSFKATGSIQSQDHVRNLKARLEALRERIAETTSGDEASESDAEIVVLDGAHRRRGTGSR